MHLFSCPRLVVAADHSGHNTPSAIPPRREPGGIGGKKPGKLSRRGRTLCAPTEHDVFLSSGRIALHKFRQPNTQRSACVFGPSLNHAPTVRDRERSKPPGKRFALWPVWSRATTDGCILPRSGHYGSTESFHCYLKNTFIFRRSNH